MSLYDFIKKKSLDKPLKYSNKIQIVKRSVKRLVFEAIRNSVPCDLTDSWNTTKSSG